MNIDYEQFNKLKDLYYIMETISDLNFQFKDQIDLCQNSNSKKKFEAVDFVGATLSRLDLEFKYFKNHLTSIWPDKYSSTSHDNLLAS